MGPIPWDWTGDPERQRDGGSSRAPSAHDREGRCRLATAADLQAQGRREPAFCDPHPPSPIAAGVMTRGLEGEGPADQDQDLAEVSSMCVAFRVVCQTG
jgi:hypothetical protein